MKKPRMLKRLLVGAAAITFIVGTSATLLPAAAHAQPAVPWGAKIMAGVPVVGSFVVAGKRYPVYRPHVSPRDAAALLTALRARGATRSRSASIRPAAYRTDEITNSNSSKCLEVNGWSKSNGAQVDQWTCYSGHANQTWEWQLEGSVSIPGGSNECCDLFELVNQNSGKCLEAYNWGTSNGTKIDQWTCYDDGNQEWIEDPGIPCSYQSVTFANYNAYLLGNGGMVFEVYQQSKSNGAKVDLYQSNGGLNQHWTC
jgi:Ricin-type beta-trefoil lectin domain